MKRIIAMLVAAVVLMTAFSAFAEELPSITFRGLSFGMTYRAAVENGRAPDGAIPVSVPYIGRIDEIIYRSEYLEGLNLIDPDEKLSSIMLMSYDSGVDVAGYTAYQVDWRFVRPLVDGKISMNDDDAIFYAGWYSIQSPDYRALEKDLTEKLTTLYGEPEGIYDIEISWGVFEKAMIVWQGRDDIRIILTTDGYSGCRLAYVWMGAQELIDAVYSAEEAVEPVEATYSLNGL